MWKSKIIIVNDEEQKRTSMRTRKGVEEDMALRALT